MWTKLYSVNGPWPGKLALSAQPRGGDWLADELAAWKQAGIGVVFSLLTSSEESDLDLRDEARQVKDCGMKFISLPIPDREVPNSESEVRAVLERIEADLSSGTNVVVHCRQGLGRSGLMVSCLLVSKGASPERAVADVSAARGVEVPETKEQRRWIDHYAAVLAGAR